MRTAGDYAIKLTLKSFDAEAIKARAVKSYNQATQFHFLKEGPAERGSKRSSFKFRDATEGDVYDVLTRIIALNPPFVSISLDDIKARMKAICCDGEDPNIRAALNQIKSVFKDGGDPVQWDDDKRLLAVIDPHFYFYMRCQLPNELVANGDNQVFASSISQAAFEELQLCPVKGKKTSAMEFAASC